MKSEPGTYSWNDQVKRGDKGEPWSGVRNHQAKLNLMKMKKGERAFFYHSGDTKEIVGIVEIVREHYPDPTAKPGEPWVAVDVKAVEPMIKPVRLADAKAEPRLKAMVLVNNTRLSVQPVTAEEWKVICKMGGLKG
jgi:predicted RNA-binding protein with PUA-like domain